MPFLRQANSFSGLAATTLALGKDSPAVILSHAGHDPGRASCATSWQNGQNTERQIEGETEALRPQYLLTLLAGPVGGQRMRSSEQAVALGLLLLTYSLGSPA